MTTLLCESHRIAPPPFVALHQGLTLAADHQVVLLSVQKRPRRFRSQLASPPPQQKPRAMSFSIQIGNRFLIWGVTAAAVLPRHPHDRGCIVGGGHLTSNFRKMLLVIVGLNFIRLFLSENQHSSNVYAIGSDLLGVVEVSALTFLCFLLPYVLQQGLSEYFNIRPGEDLKLPLLGTAVLSFAGVVLSRTAHPNFWALKKLANILSGPVVIRTLRSYNTFTTRQSHGRGFVIAQTVMVNEYSHIIVQLLCAVAYAFNRNNPVDQDSSLDTLMRAIRGVAMPSDWMRILVHAIFLNHLDELFVTTPSGAFQEADELDPEARQHGPHVPLVTGEQLVPRRSRR